jgi:hypothetical protein
LRRELHGTSRRSEQLHRARDGGLLRDERHEGIRARLPDRRALPRPAQLLRQLVDRSPRQSRLLGRQGRTPGVDPGGLRPALQATVSTRSLGLLSKELGIDIRERPPHSTPQRHTAVPRGVIPECTAKLLHDPLGHGARNGRRRVRNLVVDDRRPPLIEETLGHRDVHRLEWPRHPDRPLDPALRRLCPNPQGGPHQGRRIEPGHDRVAPENLLKGPVLALDTLRGRHHRNQLQLPGPSAIHGAGQLAQLRDDSRQPGRDIATGVREDLWLPEVHEDLRQARGERLFHIDNSRSDP